MKTTFTTFIFFLFSSSFLTINAQKIYVNYAATGMNDGTSWTNAYTHLDTALREAFESVPTIDTIWVAQGIYTPDVMNGEPASAFRIRHNVTLLGGFSGSGALECRKR